MDELKRKLQLIKNEDFIWIIYYFITTFALVSNKLEKDSLIYKDKRKKQSVNNINMTILIVAFLIYLYFVVVSYENFQFIKDNHNKKEVRLAMERLLLNILFLVVGAYAIYVSYDEVSSNSDVDIAIF